MKRMEKIKQNNDGAIQTLMDLGLTSCQARIYMTLVQNRKCTAKIISRISKVTRQDVYRIMPKLEKSGLARKVLDTPIGWEATPLKDGLAILMDLQNERFLQLQTKTLNLLDSFKEMKTKTVYRDKEPEFVIISGGKQQKSWWKEKLEKLHTCLDCFTEFEGFGAAHLYFGECFKKAFDNGVKFRIIFFTSEDKKVLATKKALLDLDPNFGYPHVQSRFFSTSSNSVGMVLDGNEACFYTKDLGLKKSPMIWSKNPYFVEIFKNYFEMLWNSAS